MQAAADATVDARPTVLFVEEDDNALPLLKRGLRSLGYRVLMAACVEDAAEWLSCCRVRADLVLLDLVRKTTDEALGLGRRVREQAACDGRTPPLVVMAEKYGKDVEGKEVNAGGNDWILYLGEEPDQLKNLLARLLA